MEIFFIPFFKISFLVEKNAIYGEEAASMIVDGLLSDNNDASSNESYLSSDS